MLAVPGEIYLDISSSIEAGSSGGDVSVDVDDDGYDVEDVEITNEPSGEWDDGDKPRIRVTLSADDDYYFSSGIDEDDVDLSGDGGSVTDVSSPCPVWTAMTMTAITTWKSMI